MRGQKGKGQFLIARSLPSFLIYSKRASKIFQSQTLSCFGFGSEVHRNRKPAVEKYSVLQGVLT